MEREFQRIIDNFEKSVIGIYKEVIKDYDYKSFAEITDQLNEENIMFDKNKLHIIINSEIKKRHDSLSADPTKNIINLSILFKMKEYTEEKL
jgi:hypothetical protein